jgi:hypothetical protein
MDERVLKAIDELKSNKSPLFGSKYHVKGKLKRRIKKGKNFESIVKKQRQKMLNSSFGGIRSLALKCGISPDSKEYKALLEKGMSFIF